MSRILNVGHSDYRVRVVPGGTITLDTESTGKVVITGDLEVQGETTTINTTNTDIEDNIITLNKGESPTHAGVSEITSGIEIDRGSLPKAAFLFDENSSQYNPYRLAVDSGNFTFRDAENFPKGIQVSGIANAGNENLVFDLQNTQKVLKVVRSFEDRYESYLSHDDDIPNLKWVRDQLVRDIDRIFYREDDPPGSGNPVIKTQVQTFADAIKFFLDKDLLNSVGEFNDIGFTAGQVNLDNNFITGLDGVESLVLSSLSGQVTVNAILALSDQSDSTILPELDLTKVYAAQSDVKTPGDTNLFFINTQTSGELVSKNRALLFSMIF